jgi:uncharacterized HAD superfamily protein
MGGILAVRLNHDGPVVALDIDGTLSDYHGYFLAFAEKWCGKPMPLPEAINPGLPLYRHMHVSKARYRECKLAFRQGGLKRSMPVYEGAQELSRAIRKAGAELWITTSRPYLRLDNIDPDTREWLRRNKIQYDAVIYGTHKYRDLARIVGVERVAAVLDDLPEMIEQAATVGLPYLMRDQPYNRHVNYSSVANLIEAQQEILWLIEQWRKEHDRS